MRIRGLIVATVVGLASALAVPLPAQAVGGGCRLSANWWVSTSAQWSGSKLKYAVASSPGVLDIGDVGTVVDSEAGEDTFYSSAYLDGKYIYRADVYANSSYAFVWVRGGNSSCWAQMYR
jgi:hypothetical protein